MDIKTALDEQRLNINNDMSSPTKIFIGGLNWQTTAETLKEYFGQFGPIEECTVMKDLATNRSRGFGFINFTDSSSVERVLTSGPHTVDSKVVEAKVAFPRPKLGNCQLKESMMEYRNAQSPPQMVTRTRKIFIGGVSSSTTKEDLLEFFGRFGKITDANLMMDKVTNRHRGFAFITFESEDVVESVCCKTHYEVNRKMVEVKKAQPKEVMEEQSKAQNGSYAVAIPQQYFQAFNGGYPLQAFYPAGYIYDPSTGLSSIQGPNSMIQSLPPACYTDLASMFSGPSGALSQVPLRSSTIGLMSVPTHVEPPMSLQPSPVQMQPTAVQLQQSALQFQAIMQRSLQSPNASAIPNSGLVALTEYSPSELIMNGYALQSSAAGIPSIQTSSQLGIPYQGQILHPGFQSSYQNGYLNGFQSRHPSGPHNGPQNGLLNGPQNGHKIRHSELH